MPLKNVSKKPNVISKMRSNTTDQNGRSKRLAKSATRPSESFGRLSAMAKLEIGYIAGSAPSLDGRLGAVRSQIEKTIYPHRLVTVSTFARTDLPIIVDITVAGYEVDQAVSSMLSRNVVRPWLFIRQSDRAGISDVLLEKLPVSVYRNAINVRPIVLKFLIRYPGEIREPVTHHALSVTRTP